MSWREAMALFDRLVDQPEDAQRAALSSATPEVASLVAGMLSADADTRGVATGLGSALLTRDIDRSEPALPTALPGFHIHGLLGRGGMGVVLDAEQLSPRRPVAIKMVDPQRLSDHSAAWLRAEAEALATVLHPGIPQVHDLIEHDGAVFIVMERVDGAPLRSAITSRDRTERIALMLQITQAVAHAHGRGVLHLDLKPANVLVTHDGSAKVLDFGLARLVDERRPGVVAGTPGYMAPEQRQAGPVDVRSDVFALGMLLFTLLDGDVNHMVTVRGDAGPTGPRFGVPDVEMASSSPSTLTPSDARAPLADRDLHAIIDRATQADPERRYPTVDALSRDLRAWRDHFPVEARSASVAYRVGKFLRRHPLPVAAGLLAALSLVAATGISLDRAVQAERARVVAEQAQHEAERARQTARADAERARSTAGFLSEVFLRLNPNTSAGERTLLDATLTAIARLDEGALDDAPSEEAGVRNAVGEALLHLGRRDEALVQFQATIDLFDVGGHPADSLLIDGLHGRAILRRLDGDLEAAFRDLDRAAQLAIDLDDPVQGAEIDHAQGVALLRAGRDDDARSAFARSLAAKRALLVQDRLAPLRLVNTMNQLAWCHLRRGDFDDAEPLFSESLAIRRADADGPRADIANSLHWLAQLEHDRERDERALPYLDEAIALRDALDIGVHASSRSAEPSLRSRILVRLGRYDEAEREIESYILNYLDGDEDRVERHDAWTLAQIHLARGRTDLALAVADRAFALESPAVEGSGAWAWGHTVRGLVRARVGHPGAREDLTRASSVWTERMGANGPRARMVNEALSLLR